MYPSGKIVRNFHGNRFNICKMPRQSGKSTTVVSYLLHYALFNDVLYWYTSQMFATARELLGRLQTHMKLPMWMQQVSLHGTRVLCTSENKSKIVAASTSASAVRGMSFNIIFLDEFAFIPNHIADDFFSSVYPTISSANLQK